jgi:transcriptional regulator NrdR family protein
MTHVIKKKGIKEPFNADKIRKSIKKSFVDAGLSIKENKENIEYIIKNLVLMAKDKTEISTKAIRDTIIQSLTKNKKRASESWKKFERKYKKQPKSGGIRE